MSSTTASTASPTLTQLGRVLDPLGPAHLGDVDQALDALLELDEGAVVGEADHLALDAVPTGYFSSARCHGSSWICFRPRLTRSVSGSNLSTMTRTSSPTSNISRRVADAAPGHVGDVEQAVDAAEVDEGAVVGEVLHHALEDRALLQVLEGLLLQLLALLLEQHAAREDDVAALLVELDDLELEALADELVEVAHRADVDLRARAGTPSRRCRPRGRP